MNKRVDRAGRQQIGVEGRPIDITDSSVVGMENELNSARCAMTEVPNKRLLIRLLSRFEDISFNNHKDAFVHCAPYKMTRGEKLNSYSQWKLSSWRG